MNHRIVSLIAASAVAVPCLATVAHASDEGSDRDPAKILAQAQDAEKETPKRVEQLAEKVGDLGTDEVTVSAIIRAANKQGRMNKLLEEKGSDLRVTGIEIENAVPPKAVFIVTRESK